MVINSLVDSVAYLAVLVTAQEIRVRFFPCHVAFHFRFQRLLLPPAPPLVTLAPDAGGRDSCGTIAAFLSPIQWTLSTNRSTIVRTRNPVAPLRPNQRRRADFESVKEVTAEPNRSVGARRTGPIETFIGDHRLGTPMIATTAANPIY